MKIQSLIISAVASVIVVAMGGMAFALAGFGSHSGVEQTCEACGVVVSVRHTKSTKRYDVEVRMSDGSLRTVTYFIPPGWKAGDRVRLEYGKLVG